MPFDPAAQTHPTIAPERPSAPLQRLAPAWLVLAAVLRVTTAALRYLSPPAAQDATAPATAFAAARAMQHVERIAAHPHPLGTPENAQVLAYLKEQLAMLGYQPEVQRGMVLSQRGDVAGQVNNLVVRVPGSSPGKAVMLSAHYDSAPFSPGAGDDGASVAAILETLRVLKTGAPLKNDLIVMLADGEEAGMLGARLFVAKHRWAKDVGLALNFDFRGNSGLVWMFETSAGNDKLIDGWAGALAKPMGNSLLVELYKAMPNDTDLSVYKAMGVPAMNFAAGEGHTNYHSQLDRADLLNQGTLQHEGESMLALARHFGNAPLGELSSGDRIYFNLPGAGVVNYPGSMALPLCAALLLAFGALTVMAARTARARAAKVMLAVPAFLLGAAAVAFGCQVLWMAIKLVHPGYSQIVHGTPYNGAWYLAAFAALALGLYAVLLQRLERWFKPAELALGAMACAMLLLAVTSLAMPGASFVFAWPAVPVLAALAWLWSAKGRALQAPVQLCVLAVASIPALLILSPIVKLLFIALTLAALPVTIMILMLMLGMVTPLVQALRRPYVLPLLPLLACAGLLVGGALSAGFSAAQPQPNSLMYAQNAMDGKAYWVSDDAELDSWSGRVFSAKPHRQALKDIYGPNAVATWVQPAPPLTAAAPTIRVLSDSSAGGKRSLSLEIASPRQAPELVANVDGAAIESFDISGLDRAAAPVAAARSRIGAYAMGATPLRLELVVKAGHPFVVRVRDRSYGLPASAGTRPATMIVQPFGASDTTAMVSTMAFQ